MTNKFWNLLKKKNNAKMGRIENTNESKTKFINILGLVNINTGMAPVNVYKQ